MDEARGMIRAAAGSHFDPQVVAAFEAIPDTHLREVLEALR
jgi:response regulator RpfG family c-di-GMP phosphodiesterase